jgi:hypothetical protein
MNLVSSAKQIVLSHEGVFDSDCIALLHFTKNDNIEIDRYNMEMEIIPHTIRYVNNHGIIMVTRIHCRKSQYISNWLGNRDLHALSQT